MVGVKTSELEEKATAAHMISTYAAEIKGGGFFPYVEQVMSSVHFRPDTLLDGGYLDWQRIPSITWLVVVCVGKRMRGVRARECEFLRMRIHLDGFFSRECQRTQPA